jgi:hypothetical protein
MDGLALNNSTHRISQSTNLRPTAAGPPPAVNYSTHPIDGLANSRPTQGTSLSFAPAIPTNQLFSQLQFDCNWHTATFELFYPPVTRLDIIIIFFTSSC